MSTTMIIYSYRVYMPNHFLFKGTTIVCLNMDRICASKTSGKVVDSSEVFT